jgi:hypothetical protein
MSDENVRKKERKTFVYFYCKISTLTGLILSFVVESVSRTDREANLQADM